MTIALFDLAKPTVRNAGGGGGIKSEIILIQEADIDWDTFPQRDADGVTIADDIQLLTGKFMHSLYMTQGTIKPSQKKLKGSNQDCGGYEIGLEGFYPGIEKAVQKWIQNFGIDFKGIVIIQNCASNKRYLIGEPCLQRNPNLWPLSLSISSPQVVSMVSRCTRLHGSPIR